MAEQLTVNGVPVQRAAQWTADRTITLPSGASAEIRKGKGRDLRRVMTRLAAAAGREEDSAGADAVFGLIAELVRVEGAPIMLEDLEEMELADVFMLQNEVVGRNFSPARRPVSSPSSSAGSPSRN